MLLLIVALLACPLQVFGQTSSSDDQDISVIVGTSQSLNKDLRDCIKVVDADDCLEREDTQSPESLTFKQRFSRTIETADQSLWTEGLSGDVLSGHLKKFFGVLTLAAGKSEIHTEDVLADPNKAFYEKQIKGTPGVWIKDWFKVIPQVGFALRPDSIGPFSSHKKSFNISVDQDFIIRYVKRVSLKSDYGHSFLDNLKKDIELAEDAPSIYKPSIPFLFALPTSLKALEQFHPGEGVELERYHEYHFDTGPFVRFLSSNLGTVLVPGVYGYLGLQVSYIPGNFDDKTSGKLSTLIKGHFRTTLVKQIDGTVRATIESIDQRSYKLRAEAGVGILAGLFDYLKSFVKIVLWQKVTAQERYLDLIFDLTKPAARHALLESVKGDWGPAEELAVKALAGEDTGVRNNVPSPDLYHYADMNLHRQTYSLLLWTWETDKSQRKEFVSPDRDPKDKKNKKRDIYTLEQKKHRPTLHGRWKIDLTTSTDFKIADKNHMNSLAIKYNIHEKILSSDVLKQMVLAMEVLAPQPRNPQEEKFLSGSAEILHQEFYTHIFIEFLGSSFNQLISADPTFTEATKAAWRKIFSLPENENLDNEDAFRSKYEDIPQLLSHYENFEKFLKAITNPALTGLGEQQAKAVFKALGSINNDLYPLLSVAMVMKSDFHSHIVYRFRRNKKDHFEELRF